MKPHKPKLKTINSLLLILIVLVNGYVIVAPFVPQLLFRIQSHTGREQQLSRKISQLQSTTTQPSTSQANQVIIPSMLLDQNILEGPISQTYNIHDKGVWRWPNGSTPDKGGNTVLIGHRFTYTNPRGVFYFLNKVQLGDSITMYWNNKVYTYKVTNIHEVQPSDISIEDPTTQAQLTIFTCTPLLLPKDRLVVVAQLEAS